MSDFKRKTYYYKGDQLCTQSKGKEVALTDLIEDLERPAYVYNSDCILERVSAYKKAFSSLKTHIHYAMKANSNLEVLKLIQEQGLGVDVVSIGEFKKALEAGFKPKDIIFSGVAKTKTEIKEALLKGVFQINTESLSEVKRIISIAKDLNLKAKIGVRINPDIPVDTHPYITTGFRENKFGLPLIQLYELSKILNEAKDFISLQGISCHIGSQIMDPAPLVKAAESVLRVCKELRASGHEIKYLDLGGGLGVDYHSNDEEKDVTSILEFGKAVAEIFKDFDGEILLEPGRSLVARSGILLSRVEYVKSNGYKDFIVVNTGMHHLMRPSLYQAYHKLLLVEKREGKSKTYDVVGPICESSDVLGFDRNFTDPKEEDWLAVLDAGAYGFVMASDYNHHAMPVELLV